MSDSPLPIIVFGHDPSLLETRQWVLERADFAVETASNLAEAERLIRLRPRDLLILCHSLPFELCRMAIAAAHKLRPGMKIIVMSAGTEIPPIRESDDVISSFDGPRALVAGVTRLLSRPVTAAH